MVPETNHFFFVPFSRIAETVFCMFLFGFPGLYDECGGAKLQFVVLNVTYFDWILHRVGFGYLHITDQYTLIHSNCSIDHVEYFHLLFIFGFILLKSLIKLFPHKKNIYG